jgi:hypothetical protein
MGGLAMGYSRTAFSVFISVFFSLILIAVCTGAGLFVSFFLAVAHIFGTVSSAQPGSNPVPDAPSLFNLSNPTLLIAPGIGFALGLLLAILISSAVLKRTADVNWLEKHGRRVMAEIKGINQHRGSRTDANGNSTYYTYYIITSEWVDPATRIIHTFNSDQIYSPGRYQVGDAIQVWIDPKNAGKYVVNVA